MKLSERIAVLQAALALHGDVQVLQSDTGEGFTETFIEPEICKDIDGQIVSTMDYEMRLKMNVRREELIASITDAWDTIGADLQKRWGSREVMTERLMEPIHINDAILATWPTAPVVLII